MDTTDTSPSNDVGCSLAVSPNCCDIWPQILSAFDWWSVVDEPTRLMMPNIKTVNESGKQTSWRVNHCPSCGKEIRNVIISRDMLEIARADLPLTRY